MLNELTPDQVELLVTDHLTDAEQDELADAVHDYVEALYSALDDGSPYPPERINREGVAELTTQMRQLGFCLQYERASFGRRADRLLRLARRRFLHRRSGACGLGPQAPSR